MKNVGRYFLVTQPIAFAVAWAFAEGSRSFPAAPARVPFDLRAFVAIFVGGIWTILTLPALFLVNRMLPPTLSSGRRRIVFIVTASLIAAATTLLFAGWIAVTPVGIGLIIGSGVFGAIYEPGGAPNDRSDS